MQLFKGLLIAALVASPVMASAEDKNQAATLPGAVKLSDKELDMVTAGGAFVVTEVSNAGNSNVLKFNNNGILCVNCFGASTPDNKTISNNGNAEMLKVLPSGRIMCINC